MNTPGLFNNEDLSNEHEDETFSSFANDTNDEDELEIPALLRKQKN